MRREAKHHEGCEYTDPYLYGIFAPAERSDSEDRSSSGKIELPESRPPRSSALAPLARKMTPREKGDRKTAWECRRDEVRILFLTGLFPHF